jgi:hypothetical protein
VDSPDTGERPEAVVPAALKEYAPGLGIDFDLVREGGAPCVQFTPL